MTTAPTERLLPKDALEQEQRIEKFVSGALDLVLSSGLTWDEVVESFGYTSKVLAMASNDSSRIEAEAKNRFNAGMSRRIENATANGNRGDLH